jgi:MFS family permease
MVEYKWIALSNTTLGVLMAAIDINIVIISLPAIFLGIAIDPLSSFQYLLWNLFGYSIVTATLLVTFGRLSDMFGRVRLELWRLYSQLREEKGYPVKASR